MINIRMGDKVFLMNISLGDEVPSIINIGRGDTVSELWKLVRTLIAWYNLRNKSLHYAKSNIDLLIISRCLFGKYGKLPENGTRYVNTLILPVKGAVHLQINFSGCERFIVLNFKIFRFGIQYFSYPENKFMREARI